MDEIVALLEPTVKTFRFQSVVVRGPAVPESVRPLFNVLSKATVAAVAVDPPLHAAIRTTAAAQAERRLATRAVELEVEWDS